MHGRESGSAIRHDSPGPASVIGIDVDDAGQIVAVWRTVKAKQRIPLLELAVPKVKPCGWEWVETYRRWGGRG